MADGGAKCWKRREILKQMAVASTVMMVQGKGMRTKGDARRANRDFEIQVASISAQMLRLSVLPVANGRVSAVPMNASDGGFGGAIGMNADLTVLKLRERRLTEALRIERTVLDSAGQALAVVKDGMVARCNDAFLHLL